MQCQVQEPLWFNTQLSDARSSGSDCLNMQPDPLLPVSVTLGKLPSEHPPHTPVPSSVKRGHHGTPSWDCHGNSCVECWNGAWHTVRTRCLLSSSLASSASSSHPTCSHPSASVMQTLLCPHSPSLHRLFASTAPFRALFLPWQRAPPWRHRM